MVTIFYTINHNQLIHDSPSVTIIIDDNKFVTDMNSFALFMNAAKNCIFIEKKNSGNKFARFKTIVKKMLDN